MTLEDNTPLNKQRKYKARTIYLEFIHENTLFALFVLIKFKSILLLLSVSHI